MSRSIYVLPDVAERRGVRQRALFWRDWAIGKLGPRLVEAGVSPSLLGNRFRPSVPAVEAATESRTVHPGARLQAKVAGGFESRSELIGDPGWWGFSFRDVPDRLLHPTRMLTFRNARVLAIRSGQAQDYTPAVVVNGRSVELREIRYRPVHATLANRTPDLELDDALWVAERVFDNYSHWFSAHLPKLEMLRREGALGNLVLPDKRPAWVDASLARIGIEKDDFLQLPTPGVLRANTLRLVECDRFRPELLRDARARVTGDGPKPDRRVFVSRKLARGRTLLEEAELEPLLLDKGFELVAMEALSFDEQADLMSRTQVMLAPHGAGLTNMLFCPEGARIAEIADPAYPNPNFYAMAAALGHQYDYIAGKGVGEGHPLRHDLSVRIDDVKAFLDTLP